MKAAPVFKEKRIIENKTTGQIGIVELKIWKVPKSNFYPEGRKFSLFLVAEGKVLVGVDNHKPKGPHLHFGDEEVIYDYINDKSLIEDFWNFVGKVGFKI